MDQLAGLWGHELNINVRPPLRVSYMSPIKEGNCPGCLGKLSLIKDSLSRELNKIRSHRPWDVVPCLASPLGCLSHATVRRQGKV